MDGFDLASELGDLFGAQPAVAVEAPPPACGVDGLVTPHAPVQDGQGRLPMIFGRKKQTAEAKVARAVGKDRATVANLLRLLKLPAEIQKGIVEGKITEGHARALLSVEDRNAWVDALRLVVGSMSFTL